MARKCKNCDPNKYIDGIAWRGANGHDFSNIYSYNDIGEPTDLGISANVADMVDAYNPIFTASPGAGLAKVQNEPAYIRGIDRNAGFWFIWDFTKGMTAFGTPNDTVTTAKISNFHIDYTNLSPDVSKYDGDGNLVGLIQAEYIKNSGSKDIIITTKDTDNIGYKNHNLYLEENNILGICFDQNGVGYYTSPESNLIYKLNKNDTPFIFAGYNGLIGTGVGSTYVRSNTRAWTSSTTAFNHPRGICIKTGDNSIYVADTNNHRICKITQTTQTISNVLYYRTDTTILAGLSEESGSNDGVQTNARFNKPNSVIIDYSGNNLYIADTENHTIRRITLSGVAGQVTTIAGKAGEFGTGDAINGTGARFHFPRGLTLANGTGLYIADTNNHTIRVIDLNPNLNFPVSTIAGTACQPNYLDHTGSSARFNYPVSLCTESGSLSFNNHTGIFIADRKNHCIRKLNLNTKEVTTFVGKGQESSNSFNITNNAYGSYAQNGQTITLTINNHGYVQNKDRNDIGTEIFLQFINGSAKSDYYLILSILDGNRFTVGSTVSQVTSGNVYISSTRSLKLNRPSALAEDNSKNLYIFHFTNNSNVNFLRKISGKNIEFNNITYNQPAATYIDFTLNNHNLSNGDKVYIRFKTGTPTIGNGTYEITYLTNNTFRISNIKKGTTSGTAEIIKTIYNVPTTISDKNISILNAADYLSKDTSSSIYFDPKDGLLSSRYAKIKSIIDKRSFIIEDDIIAPYTIGGSNTKAKLNFASQVITNSLAVKYEYNGFIGFKESSDVNVAPNDLLKFNEFNPISTLSYLTKKQILKVGYYTGNIISTTLSNTKPLYSQQSTTIVVKDSLDNDPIFVTSSPILVAFKGQLSYYQFKTNIKNGPWYIELSETTKDILNKLGLTYNDDDQSISGLISDDIQNEVNGSLVDFIIYNDDRSRGQEITFKLLIVSGEQSSNKKLKSKPVIDAPSYIYNYTFDPSAKSTSNAVDLSLANFTNMDGKEADEKKFYNISSFPSNSFFNGLTFNASTCKLTGKLNHAGRGILKVCAANTQGKSDDIYIVFNVAPYSYNDASVGNAFPLSIKLPVASTENIGKNIISIKFRTYGDEIFEFKKITNDEAAYIIDPKKGNGRPQTIPTRDFTFSPNDKSDTYKKGKDMDFVEFRPSTNLTNESKFWMYVEDPTVNTLNNNGTRPEVAINVEGAYSITDGFSPFVDALGNTCYKPDPNSFGPVSTPIYQDLNLIATNLVKTSFSANPIDNLPTIQIQINGGANISPEYQIYFFAIGGGATLTKVGNEANKTLSKSSLPKYPLGIPNSRGTYLFYIRFADTCTFNTEIRKSAYDYTPIVLYVGTYTQRAGDVYQCVHYVPPKQYGTRCFPKDTKIFTPNGWKNIQDFQIEDKIYACDENQNIQISKVVKVLDHDLIPDKVYKVLLENGKIIRSNMEHPFLTDNNLYVPLKKLKAGDHLITFNKKKIKILDIIYDTEEPVYNLEVEKYHTYIAEGIFVHNMGGYGYYNGGEVTDERTARYLGYVPEYYNYTLVNSAIPGNCDKLISQIGASKTINGYGFRYTNTFLESKDIGITTLSNISVLDVLSEGPIEGITDYEIKPNQCSEDNRRDYPEQCPQIGDIGWSKKGVQVNKYPGISSFIRSIYWNETPLADDTYSDGSKGSLNFDFIKIKFDNADKAPQHTHAQNLKEINISEDLNTQKIGNGIPLENIYIFSNDGAVVSSEAKIPKLLTLTKTIGQRIFGKRVFKDGTSRTYKKSFNILTQDLYGLRFHIKISALSKTIVDLTIWESFDSAENNATSGRIDRLGAYFNLKLKKINRGTNNEGQVVETVTYQKNGQTFDYWRINCIGKILKGGYIETFEWLGLDKIVDKNTIGWEVEIEALHEESVDANILIECGADSITEIYQDRLIFPHTASVLSTFDARYFTSIPQRYYDVRLLKVKIPSNYNPFSKTYSGTWDGTFKIGWTDNPAWCFYDLVTNNRFGLGKYVNSKFIDKWTLYDISKYCDQLVSDGRGGLEPRFTCNILISTREDAYKVINDMASIFRAIVYYNAGLIFTSQDKPKEPIYLFNNSNIKNGEFTYNDTSKRVRRNVILVRYNNKDNFFKPAVKYIENREGLIRFGIREMDVTAFGCTSEGQAERLGRWTLLSENLEAEIVIFETSLPALYLKPGDVILVQDENRQNKILGGRALDLNKNYAVLDLKYQNITGYKNVISGCKFNVLTPAGNIEVGTPSGDKATELYMQNTSGISIPLNINGQTTTVNQIDENLLRRSQVQHRDLGLSLNGPNFFDFVSEETGINYSGFTRINLSSFPLDDSQHTLLKNTVWTLEVDPNFYNYINSPSVSGISTTGIYPGASLEPYMDKTQKFRILDLEEKEDYLYKITALQYNEDKFSLTDNI